MHFFKHWAKAAWHDGEIIREAWGWSDSSVADARRSAEERARRFAATSSNSGRQSDVYGYPDRPLRELVLRTLADSPELRAIITRNSYGCEVMNTDRAVFIDVDLPARAQPARPGFFDTLFGRSTSPPVDEQRDGNEARAIARLQTWQCSHPQLVFRVYRTAAGLRYLLTSTPLAPEDPIVSSMMDAAGADPDYRRLCGTQKSFRARLTPKPWRCGSDRPPHRFPFSDASQNSAIENWLSAYARVSSGYATCFHLLDLGTAQAHPTIAPIAAEHDRLTRAESGLPLA